RPLVLLAMDRTGYANLCRLISRARLRCPKGRAVSAIRDVADFHEGLCALAPDAALLPPLAPVFGDRLYALATRHLHAPETAAEIRLRKTAARYGVPVVAGTEVLYHVKARSPLQDVMTCIRHRTRLDEAAGLLRPNAEHHLRPPAEFLRLFADDPAAVARTFEVAERCSFRLSDLRYRYPADGIEGGRDRNARLRDLVFEGARRRYDGHVPDGVRRQLDHELALVAELDYGGYFLTMWEIVQFCRRNGILCQGRGSAANSAVCYCLGITAIDPVRMDLLFERFVSRERAEPPDIDLDIEHARREEVIQWVFRRYGRRHAAMLPNVVRYRGRSAVRDVGKALGIPPDTLDRLAGYVDPHGGALDDVIVAHAGLDPRAPRVRRLVELSRCITDMPRHLSIHPGGFLLGAEPVDTLVPIEPATMERRTVIQWDKYDVEAMGLFKVDLLGLGALRHIHLCFDLLRKHEGIDLDMATVPAEDPMTYAMLSRADALGVFQLESRAQMAMLPRVQPRTFYDLVVEVALVRPGPIQGDMVHPYLRRRQGKEPVTLPHPKLERVLAKTLGVPIFQEQVMKLAMVVGGYGPGEADRLRRDMAAWRAKGRIERHHDRLVGGMIANGIDPDFAERIFDQIRGFGEYGFPESHAASFALVAYVTAWLRCHHLPAFTCALLNAQPMGFYPVSAIVSDARRHGVEIRPPCVQRSAWDSTLEPAPDTPHRFALRLGLRLVRGLGDRERAALEAAERPFADLGDFVRRTGLARTALDALAEAGAFACFGVHRRQALWDARGLAAAARDTLAGTCRTDGEAPDFSPLSRGQAVLWDHEVVGASALDHLLAAIRPALRARGLPLAREVNRRPHGARVRYAGWVLCRQRPGTASGITFYTLEDETGFVNLVVFRDVFDRHERLARGARLLGVDGTIQRAEGTVHLVVERMWAPRIRLPDVRTRSRDFH
ncbi:MAG: DNA polymerase III subunit alpha, partial [Deltaproteobacteria bacterium]